MTQLFSIYTLLVLITVSLVLSTSAEANDSLQDNDLLVKTKTNVLQGISTEDGSVNAWLGIPFAEPPINDLRWKSPIMKQSSDETLILSDQFSPSCYQSSQQSLGEFGPHNVTVSEDCLTLNIWSPSSKPPNTLLPVVVFIHGGAFINGDATFYPGTTLVKQSNIIYISIQYRLNVFGFFDLGEQEEVNFGLQDQQLALKWINENVHAFGGDKDNVTLWGQSAGGMSTIYHLLMQNSNNLFHRIMADSPGPWKLFNKSTLTSYSQVLSVSRGCGQLTNKNKLKCLRDLPAATIFGPGMIDSLPMIFQPVINDEITAQPLNLLREGKFNMDVDVLIGHNQFEGNIGAYAFTNSRPSPDAIPYSEYLVLSGSTAFGTQTKVRDVIGAYSDLYDEAKGWVAYAEQGGDGFIACGAELGAMAISTNSKRNVYSYRFDHHSSNSLLPELNATHTSELAYIFGDTKGYWQSEILTGGEFTEEELKLSDYMMESWSGFAKNGQMGTDWPLFHEENIMVLDEVREVVSRETTKKVICESFWNEIIEGNTTQ